MRRLSLLVALRRRGCATTAASAATAAATGTTLLHAAPFAFNSVGEVRGERGIFRAFCAKRLPDREVALVTVVRQQHTAVERRQRHRKRKRSRIRDRIVDGDLILDDVRCDPSDALG